MKILALDAATEAWSVALLDDGNEESPRERFEVAPRMHARELLPAAQSLLGEAGLSLSDLDGLAFGRGPGAFTGLRIAAGLVQGLAGGAGLPVVGVSTLAAMAAQAWRRQPQGSRVQVVQDARMGEIYTASFHRETFPEPQDTERVIAPDRLTVLKDDTLYAGNGWHLVAQAREHNATEVVAELPRAVDIARMAQPALVAGEGRPPAEALPVYVRDDVARKPGQ